MAVFKPTSSTSEPTGKVLSSSSPPLPPWCKETADSWCAPPPVPAFVDAGTLAMSMGTKFSCLTRKSCPLSTARTSKRRASSWHSTTRPKHPLSSVWLRKPRMTTPAPTLKGVPRGAQRAMCSGPFTLTSAPLFVMCTSYFFLSCLHFVNVPSSPLCGAMSPFKPVSTTALPSCNIDASSEPLPSFGECPGLPCSSSSCASKFDTSSWYNLPSSWMSAGLCLFFVSISSSEIMRSTSARMSATLETCSGGSRSLWTISHSPPLCCTSKPMPGGS
mmetsp:Transcript_14351/g.41416  ORF Transcript_14351/g.41416 Transcript_14351/m.41416 type:complete len:274 (+) Transcript_14351:370-1191(+)